MSALANFVVLSRLSTGELRDNPPNSPEYTYVASAINIALSLLESEPGRSHLTELALTFDSTPIYPASINAGSNRFHGNHDLARSWVGVFLSKIRARFPPVILDHTMANLDMLGDHPRGHWEGSMDKFDPRTQMIYLNGPRANDMIESASSLGGQNFRNFMFLFATTLVHEAGGHVFMTFLNNGRALTPSSVPAPAYDNGNFGESGRYLELRLFGGTTEYFRGPSQDMRQTGVPHQVDSQGRAWKISPDTINGVVRYQFQLPFGRTGNAVNPAAMQSMGFNSIDPPVDINHRTMLAQQSTLISQAKNHAGYKVRLTDVMAVPVNPTKMLAAC